MFVLPQKLKELRDKKKWRQEDVAKKIGIARTTYAMYEQGNREPDYETLIKLAELYNVSIEYILKGKESNGNNTNLFFFDTEGLNDEEIEDIKRHIAYVKWKSEQEKKVK